jgi:hypothetical protein
MRIKICRRCKLLSKGGSSLQKSPVGKIISWLTAGVMVGASGEEITGGDSIRTVEVMAIGRDLC